jgi:hypothetical protein
MLMPTDLNLVFLNSLGVKSPFAHSYTVAVLYCNYLIKVSNNVKVFGSIQK